MSDFDLSADANLLHAARNLADVVFQSQTARAAPLYLSEWSCRIDGARVTVRAKDCRRAGLEAGVTFHLPSAVEDRDRSAACRHIMAQFTAFRRDPTYSAAYDVCEYDDSPRLTLQ